MFAILVYTDSFHLTPLLGLASSSDQFGWQGVIIKTMVLTIGTYAIRISLRYFHARKVKRHEKDLLARGFPADIAHRVAVLLAEDQLEEATQVLREARASLSKDRT